MSPTKLAILLLFFVMTYSEICVPQGDSCLYGFDSKDCTEIHLYKDFIYDDNCSKFPNAPILVVQESDITLVITSNFFEKSGGLRIPDNKLFTLKGFINFEKFFVHSIGSESTIILSGKYYCNSHLLIENWSLKTTLIIFGVGSNIEVVKSGKICSSEIFLEDDAMLSIHYGGIVEVLDSMYLNQKSILNVKEDGVLNVKLRDFVINENVQLFIEFGGEVIAYGDIHFRGRTEATINGKLITKMNNLIIEEEAMVSIDLKAEVIIGNTLNIRSKGKLYVGCYNPIIIKGLKLEECCFSEKRTYENCIVFLKEGGSIILKTVYDSFYSTFDIWNGYITKEPKMISSPSLCSNIFSFNYSYYDAEIFSQEYGWLALSNNKLLRHCSSDFNFLVKCELNGTIVGPNYNGLDYSFSSIHCPCNSQSKEHCEVHFPNTIKYLKLDQSLNASFIPEKDNSLELILGGEDPMNLEGPFSSVEFQKTVKFIPKCNLNSLYFERYLLEEIIHTNFQLSCEKETSSYHFRYIIPKNDLILDIQTQTVLEILFDKEITILKDLQISHSIPIIFNSNNQITGECFGNGCYQGTFGNFDDVSCFKCSFGNVLFNGCCKPCSTITGCKSCDGIKCVSCASKYYLDQQKCSNCSLHKHCQNCNPLNGYCSGECDKGYYPDGNLCVSCSQKINCESCSTNNNTCLICANAYYPSSSTCSSCLTKTGCSICSQTEDKCLVCKEGYYPSNNGCTLCSMNTINCEKCSTTSIACTSCKNNYFLNNSKCVPCNLNNCSSCNSTNGNCFSCINNYFPSNGVCCLCSEKKNCEKCSQESNKCEKCLIGHYPNGPNCSLCSIKGCSVCNQTNDICYSCLEGYFLDAFTCKPCSLKPNCQVCSKTDNKCDLCVNGHYPSNNGCSLCSAKGCKTCNSSTGVCLTCDNEKYLSEGNCFSCSSAMNACKTCTSPTNCTECQTPSFYLSNSVCYSCSSKRNCMFCNPKTDFCEKCETNYYPNDLNCSSCSSKGCLSCDSTNGSCYSCLDGYYLNNNDCQHCQATCSKCSSSSSCIECKDGYYLNSETCLKCEGKTNCLTCSPTTNNCVTCSINYYPNGSECVTCSSKNCEKCDSSTGVCSSCIEGYYLSNGNCRLCSDKLANCVVCQSSTRCAKCSSQNYFLKNGICEECLSKPYCLKCNPFGDSCITCEDSYFPTSVGCSLCTDKLCSKCNSTTGVCTECVSSATLKNDSCSMCNASHCSNCVAGEKNCIICEPNYYLNADKLCTICDNNNINHCAKNTCSRNETGKCGSCQDGYFFDPIRSTCNSCSTNNCSVCNKDNGECYSCLSKYYFANKKCLRCDSNNAMNCEIDMCSTTQDTTCISCKNGYYMVNGKCEACHNKGCAYGKCIQTNGSCTDCPSGKYLSDGECLGCDLDNQMKCAVNECYTNQKKCYECQFGYYIDANTCHVCSDNNPNNCLKGMCSDKEKQCISCRNGYFLDSNFKCKLAYDSIQGCLEATNFTNCIKCSDGYKLFKGKCVQLSCENGVAPIGYNDNVCGSTCPNSISMDSVCGEMKPNCLKMIYEKEKSSCLQCKPNYKIQGFNCAPFSSTNCNYSKDNICFVPSFGHFKDRSFGISKCPTNSTLCSFQTETNSINYYECDNTHSLIYNFGDFLNECVPSDPHCANHDKGIYGRKSCIECEDGYFINRGICCRCDEHCESCLDLTSCLRCSEGYANVGGICKTKGEIKCNETENIKSFCTKCEESYYVDENGLCQFISINPMCLIFVNNKCLKCSTTMAENNICLAKLEKQKVLILKQNKTVDYFESCKYPSSSGCLRCSDGYYLKEYSCFSCDEKCKTCRDYNFCLSCYNAESLRDGKCVSISEVSENCHMLMPNGIGCAKCDNGYYRNVTSCVQCSNGCSKCVDSKYCIQCLDGFYKTNTMPLCRPVSELGHCLNSTTKGCLKCDDGYYIDDYLCVICKEECNNCSNKFKCTSCKENYIKSIDQHEFDCIPLNKTEKCISSKNSVCDKCEGLYRVSDDGTHCVAPSKVLIIIPIIIIIIITILLMVVMGVGLILFLHEKKKRNKKMKDICTFDMRRSNISFTFKISDSLFCNKNELRFDDELDEIPVNEESKELICIGNTGKHPIKIQISSKEGCIKYELRTSPQIITLKKNEACEFEIFIKPLCTCKIEDQIKIVSLSLRKGESNVFDVKLNARTQMGTRLDYEELKEDKKLGEGSFGIVYLGTFRGNKVAIKKMKNIDDADQNLTEFEKEVAMLDKFRSDYIIHFYGACFILNHICMVTEFAQFGSLQDLMRKRKEGLIPRNVRIKMMINSAKGIQYLHSNGILHRDIKPDNILVVSIDEKENVNAKLTDFGSSRNINQMMTNMTFTKGIGTPTYMAPEILKKQKYKKPSDVYSFAITMFECFAWCEAYPKDKFKFPWKVAEFVTEGKRLEQNNRLTDKEYNLICCCWNQEYEQRYQINQIVEELEKFIC